MATIEDYDLVGKVQEMFDDESALRKFLSDVPARHLEKILLNNGFSITKASSKLKTFMLTCKNKSRVTPRLARELSDAQEAGAFRHFKTSGRIAMIRGAPFKAPKKHTFEQKLNKIADGNEYFRSLDRKVIFTVPKVEENLVSVVLAYSNEPRPFERWIYDILILETVSRARFVLDLVTGRINARGRNETLTKEGLRIISQALTAEPDSFEYVRFDENQIKRVIKESNEPIREIILETKQSLGFIDQIVIRGTDVSKGLEMLKEQGIDLEGIGKLSGAETTSYRITSQGEFSDRRGDQSVLTDFLQPEEE